MWRMRKQSIPGPSSVRPGIEARVILDEYKVYTLCTVWRSLHCENIVTQPDELTQYTYIE